MKLIDADALLQVLSWVGFLPSIVRRTINRTPDKLGLVKRRAVQAGHSAEGRRKENSMTFISALMLFILAPLLTGAMFSLGWHTAKCLFRETAHTTTMIRVETKKEPNNVQ